MTSRQCLLVMVAVAVLTPDALHSQNAPATKADIRIVTGHYHSGHRVITRIANDRGWFREEGLGSVEIRPLGTEDDRLTLAELAAGRADIVWDAHSDIVVQEDAKGAPLAAIDVFRSFQPRNLLFGTKELTGVKDLRGKRVGVNEVDGMDAWEIRKGLERAGMNPERDVAWIPHMRGQYAKGTPIEVLQRRDVDAITAFGADAERLRTAGFPMLADLRTAFPVGYPIRFLVAHRALVEQHPGSVEAFLRAITRAKRFAADPANAAEVTDARRKLLEADVAQGGARAASARDELRTLETDTPSNRRDYVDRGGIAFLFDEQKKMRRIPANYTGEHLVHVDLLEHATAELDRRFGANRYK
jgi:ABC-type nitrate/sulfonate/bicarbonate transport system substrate-binding protein